MKALRALSSFLLTVVLSTLLYGCRESMEAVVTEVKFDLNTVKSIHDSGLITHVSLISLQQPEVTIGKISKIEVLDSLLYLLDESSKSVHIFTDAGRYVNTISARGHGAGEYINIDDIFADGENKTINILSRQNGKVYVYNAQGNKQTRILQLPKHFFKMSRTADGYIGYMGNFTEDTSKPYNYWLLDKQMRIKNCFGQIDKNLESRVSLNFQPFSSFKTNTDILTELSRDVLTLKNGDSNPTTAFALDFGPYNMLKLRSKDFTDDKALLKIKNTSIVNPTMCQETDDYLLSLVYVQGQPIIAAYNKQKDQTYALGLDAYTGDLLMSFGDIAGMNENHIYTVVDAESVHDIWKGKNEFNDFEAEHPRQVRNMRKLFRNVDPMGNPFLAIYSFRKPHSSKPAIANRQ